MKRLATLFLLSVLTPSLLVGQQTETEQKKAAGKEYDTLKAFYRQQAAEYEFTLDKSGEKKLKIQAPVLTWTGLDYKEVSDTVAPNSGEVYVWTYGGRAIVAGGVGSFPFKNNRTIFHEFHALTETPPLPTKMHTKKSSFLQRVPVWGPPGSNLKPIPNAERPSERSTPRITETRRLVEMKNLAREFTGATISEDGQTNRLKLQTNPLFRLNATELKEADSHVVDGALFVFTGHLGTDPELLLLIECHKTDEGFQWMYGPGTFTYLETRLMHDDEVVWTAKHFHREPIDGNFITELTQQNVAMDSIRAQLNKPLNKPPTGK